MHVSCWGQVLEVGVARHVGSLRKPRQTGIPIPESIAMHFSFKIVRSSAITPAPSPRNCAVDRRIAEPIGVTDVGVQ